MKKLVKEMFNFDALAPYSLGKGMGALFSVAVVAVAMAVFVHPVVVFLLPFVIWITAAYLATKDEDSLR